MKRIPKWAYCGIAICLVLAVLLLVLLPKKEEPLPPVKIQNGDALPPISTGDPIDETTPAETLPTETVPAEQTLPAAENTTPEDTTPEETTPPKKPASQETAPPATTPPATNPPAVTQPAPQYLSLPYSIPGSDLVVTQYNAFTGIYLEDGSDRSVENVAALVLENQGQSGIEYAEISLTLESGTVLKFEVTALPAGASIIVQEAQAALWQDGKLINCTAQTAVLEEFPLSRDQVLVVDESSGILSVTNLSDAAIPAVRVFYKFYMKDVNGFVGGITYTAKITDLAPGATQNIAASHYIAGFSTVVMVRTYESAD